MDIDADVASVNMNSYCTLAEADAYHGRRLFSETWTTATDPIKTSALLWAARLLDEQIMWDGWPSSFTQPMCWPRMGMFDKQRWLIDLHIVPQGLKDAQAELARYLIESDRTTMLSTEGIADMTVGSIAVTFATSKPPKRWVIPDAVAEMLALWGWRKFKSSISTIERA